MVKTRSNLNRFRKRGLKRRSGRSSPSPSSGRVAERSEVGWGDMGQASPWRRPLPEDGEGEEACFADSPRESYGILSMLLTATRSVIIVHHHERPFGDLRHLPGDYRLASCWLRPSFLAPR